MKSWAESGEIEYSDIPEFIQAACSVLKTIEPVDFALVAGGEDTKREITSNAMEIIRKGLESILKIE